MGDTEGEADGCARVAQSDGRAHARDARGLACAPSRRAAPCADTISLRGECAVRAGEAAGGSARRLVWDLRAHVPHAALARMVDALLGGGRAARAHVGEAAARERPAPSRATDRPRLWLRGDRAAAAAGRPPGTRERDHHRAGVRVGDAADDERAHTLPREGLPDGGAAGGRAARAAARRCSATRSRRCARLPPLEVAAGVRLLSRLRRDALVRARRHVGAPDELVEVLLRRLPQARASGRLHRRQRWQPVDAALPLLHVGGCQLVSQRGAA
mmetsp:Transcript_2999/g.6804  ORF Transcript_2999/g.6804 Transcript_2999/m.6804 type:complete len:272 (-) Transcript_2999:284-1099(-)